ncbi:MAG: hypothetical protein A2046_01420 [Bacteroidetes bacterium GWA2_30_7]|nr:MAG: hypothetical protein A2046_01420 [Bacteroidetes bacterium GWA2_30_7]
MNIFLDTSSLLKVYHREQDTDEILKLLSQEVENIYLSELAKIEFNSAVWKKVRTKEFIEVKAKEMITHFENDYNNFLWISIDKETISAAKELIKTYGQDGLRTLDAIQLACAVLKRNKIQKYKTSDSTLKQIFIKEKLTVC